MSKDRYLQIDKYVRRVYVLRTDVLSYRGSWRWLPAVAASAHARLHHHVSSLRPYNAREAPNPLWTTYSLLLEGLAHRTESWDSFEWQLSPLFS